MSDQNPTDLLLEALMLLEQRPYDTDSFAITDKMLAVATTNPKKAKLLKDFCIENDIMPED